MATKHIHIGGDITNCNISGGDLTVIQTTKFHTSSTAVIKNSNINFNDNTQFDKDELLSDVKIIKSKLINLKTFNNDKPTIEFCDKQLKRIESCLEEFETNVPDLDYVNTVYKSVLKRFNEFKQ